MCPRPEVLGLLRRLLLLFDLLVLGVAPLPKLVETEVDDDIDRRPEEGESGGLFTSTERFDAVETLVGEPSVSFLQIVVDDGGGEEAFTPRVGISSLCASSVIVTVAFACR